MVAEARHHHYLPQCYLRGFLPAGRKGKLTVLDLRQRNCFKTNTRNVGGERDFNRVEVKDLRPDSLEKKLSSFEGMVADALRVISQEKSLADKKTLDVVMNLIALMAIRNPQVREVWSDFMDQVSKKLSHMVLSTKERWEDTLRRMRADGIAIPQSISYEKMRDFVERGEYTVKTPTETHILNELHAINAVLPLLASRGWSLITTSEGTGPFVTCDRPVSLRWKDPGEVPAPFRQSPGFGMKNTIVLFRVSSGIVMAGEFEETDRVFNANTVYTGGKDLVARMNSQIILFAVRWVYTSDLSFSFIDYSTGQLKPGSELFNCLRRASCEGTPEQGVV
jgi:hypothetical protein